MPVETVRPRGGAVLQTAVLLALSLLSPPARAAEHAVAVAPPPRLGTAVVPTAQSLRLVLDPRTDDYTGRTAISLDVRKPTRSFWLHADGHTVDGLVLARDGSAIEVAHKIVDGRLELELAAPLAPGPATLLVAFHRPFGTKAVGLYKTLDAGEAYAVTDFEPGHARLAFPCFDEPGFKIPFEITVDVPASDLAVSNAPIAEELTEGDRRVVRFRPTKPLPTYLIAIATGPYETVPIHGLPVPGRVVVPKGRRGLARMAADMTPPILAAHEAWFGSQYPFDKLDLIAVPDFWAGAMENPGAITFREEILLQDPAQTSVAARRNLARVISHELAHMWFGDLVTMQWWDDVWLNESFADWMGDRTVVALWPELGLQQQVLVQRSDTMNGDSRATSEAIRQPVLDVEGALRNVGAQYRKGKTVIAMFESWMGPDVFRDGVRAYLRDHAWGNAVAADLWAALAKASGRDVAAAMGTFIDRPGLPLITVETLPEGRVRVRQQRFAPLEAKLDPIRWKVPLRLLWADRGGVHVTTELLERAEQTYDLGQGREVLWVHPDQGASGFYRYALPLPDLRELAAAATSRLTSDERIGFVGNLEALLSAGQIGGDELFALLQSSARDPEPAVVLAVINTLDNVEQALVPPDMEDAFAAYVRATLRPALARVGVDERAGEPEAWTLARPILIQWLGREGRDPDVRRTASVVARAYLKDPSRVATSTARAWVSVAAIEGDAALFDAYRAAAVSARLPIEREVLIGALGSFRDGALQDRALAYALEDWVRTPEMSAIVSPITSSTAGRERVWAWVQKQYPDLARRLPRQSLASLPRYAGGCDPARIEEARVFFEDPAHRVEGTERTLARTKDAVTECARLRAREGETVARYLRSAGGPQAAPAARVEGAPLTH